MRLRFVPTLIIAAAAALAQPGPPPPGGPGGGGGDGIWRRNAYYGEALTFDACVGHQPQNGMYHYHANPLCLRGQLNDNVQTVRSSRNGVTYSELPSGWHHSPILGWAVDGYPIYGPYGYSNPLDPLSGIKRIKSGFRLRPISQRTSLPDWSLPNHPTITQPLTTAQYGPDVSTTFPLGRYVEDFEWAAGVGDLDQYNGRVTLTPEFPFGTYAYYITIDDTGTPAFPYIIAAQFYGAVNGNFSANVSPSAADYFNGGTYSMGPPSPAFTSWATKHATEFARVVSGFDPSAGPVTTWPGTTTPTLGEPQRIRYTDSTVYVNSNGLAGYPMGPWFAVDMPSGVFNNFPANTNSTFQLPRNPTGAATAHSSTGMGPQGMWVNGVLMFNFLDGASYINSSGTDAMVGNTPALDATITSAASFEQGPLTPGSLVSAFPVFFSVLSTSTDSASSPDWPMTLGGATVQVRDSAGLALPASLSFASPSQLNFRMPTGLAYGAGTVVIQAGGKTITSRINIQPVYPNLFMANPNALAAGSLTRVRNGVATAAGSIAPAPIALNGDQVYLTLYGSGIGTAPSATATIGGVAATVSYAGPQGTYSGLDQYNILIPDSVAGKGKVDVIVTAGGKASNPVNITIQ
jgi:uncharacterized protein (TIGR03437 family)